jgi:hypothetical protein
MNYQFVMKPLAVMIAATFALAGCNSETASVGDGASPQPAQSASIKLGVKFPSSEVGAAWVGDASEVEVSFFRNDYVGSLDEAEDYVDARMNCDDDGDKEGDSNHQGPVFIGDTELQCWELPNDGLRQRLAKEAVLTPDSPTTSIDLIPGKYRVEAEFLDANDDIRETSVSYIDIGEGTHQIALRGISATWTAETPLTLQLLNTGEGGLDWDPETEGVQNPAQALGITGEILGLHLPSLLSYPDGLPDDNTWNVEDLLDWFHPYVQTAGRDDGTASLYVPVLRISDGSNGEIDLHPERYSEWNSTDDGGEGYGRWGNFTALYQEYNVDEGSVNYPEFGSRGIWQNKSVGGISSFDNAYVLIGTPGDTSDDDPYELDRDLYHSFNYQYWDHDKKEEVVTDIQIAEIRTEEETFNWEKLFFETLQAEENIIVDGSTITGHLIEVMMSSTSANETAMPAAFLDASLNEIAVQRGLLAAAASNCATDTGSTELEYSNQYAWDEDNARWVAGTLNQLATGSGNGNYVWQYPNEKDNLEREMSWVNQEIARVESDIQNHLDNGGSPDDIPWMYDELTGYENNLATITQNVTDLDAINQQFMDIADLNGDGSIEMFEAGVFLENPWGVGADLNIEHLDNYQRIYTFNAYGADATETVSARKEDTSVTMCVQPFTLKASELAITYSSDGEVIID